VAFSAGFLQVRENWKRSGNLSGQGKSGKMQKWLDIQGNFGKNFTFLYSCCNDNSRAGVQSTILLAVVVWLLCLTVTYLLQQFDDFIPRVRMVNWKTFLLPMTALTHSFVAEWQLKFCPKVWSVCELALLLSHGQSSVERGFLVNKELIVENQSEQTLAARLGKSISSSYELERMHPNMS